MSNSAREYTSANNASGMRGEGDLVSALFRILVRNAITITVASLVSAAVLIAAYLFLVRPVFSAETYISADKDTLARMNVFLQSPLVLDPAAEKAGLDLTSRDTARARMNRRISFRPAPGENRGDTRPSENRAEPRPGEIRLADTRIYLLDVKDPNAQTARDLSSLIVDKWRESLSPKAADRKRLEVALARQTKMKTDLDNIIAHFDKEVTTFVTPQTNSGEVATPLVKLINRRAELAGTIENLQYELEGADKFTVASGPTAPDYAQRPIGWATLLFGSFVGSFLVIVGFVGMNLLWREMRIARSADGGRRGARPE